MTARNRLLNYTHPTKGCARFIGTTLDQAFSQLATGHPLTIEPILEPSRRDIDEYWLAQGKPDCVDKLPADRWARHLGVDTDLELLNGPSRPRPVLTTLHYRSGQEALLRRLRSAARSAIEESGANLLFLAFGFLQWRDGASDGRSCLAPLLMVPVEIGLGRSAAGHAVFRLTATDEDAQHNPSLARKLEIDHGRRLPERVTGDDAPIERPEAYLARVGAAVRGLEGWTVRPYLTLGLFDFGSFLLWRDLDPANWPEGAALTRRPLLRQLIGAEAPGPVTTPAEPLDEHIDLDLTLVDRADGSQSRALVRALAGETMLIEGPPGTGKSQTITNLMAAALEQGKRVLFVSERCRWSRWQRRHLAHCFPVALMRWPSRPSTPSLTRSTCASSERKKPTMRRIGSRVGVPLPPKILRCCWKLPAFCRLPVFLAFCRRTYAVRAGSHLACCRRAVMRWRAMDCARSPVQLPRVGPPANSRLPPGFSGRHLKARERIRSPCACCEAGFGGPLASCRVQPDPKSRRIFGCCRRPIWRKSRIAPKRWSRFAPLLRTQHDLGADLQDIVLIQAISEEYQIVLRSIDDSPGDAGIFEEICLRAEAVDRAVDVVTVQTGLVEHLWLDKPRSEWSGSELVGRINLAVGAPEQLDAWLTYDLERRRAVGPAVSALIAAAETGSLPAAHLVLAWDHIVYDRAARTALDRFPVLRRHQG